MKVPPRTIFIPTGPPPAARLAMFTGPLVPLVILGTVFWPRIKTALPIVGNQFPAVCALNGEVSIKDKTFTGTGALVKAELNCTVRITGTGAATKAELWLGTQAPGWEVATAARVLGINVNSRGDTEGVVPWVRKKGLSFTILHDVDNAASAAFDVQNIPTLVLISREGKVAAIRTGVTSDEDLDRLVKDVL